MIRKWVSVIVFVTIFTLKVLCQKGSDSELCQRWMDLLLNGIEKREPWAMISTFLNSVPKIFSFDIIFKNSIFKILNQKSWLIRIP